MLQWCTFVFVSSTMCDILGQQVFCCTRCMTLQQKVSYAFVVLSTRPVLRCLPMCACADADIKAGQGMVLSAVNSTSRFRALNCDNDSYGVSNTTYGLSSSPCRHCPSGMVTNISLPNSNAYWVVDGSAQGFTSPMACVTQAGYGYNGRVASRCPVGTYNPAGSYGTCTPCPAGLTTLDNAADQAEAAHCILAVGYGFHHNAIVPCPIGRCKA